MGVAVEDTYCQHFPLEVVPATRSSDWEHFCTARGDGCGKDSLADGDNGAAVEVAAVVVVGVVVPKTILDWHYYHANCCDYAACDVEPVAAEPELSIQPVANLVVEDSSNRRYRFQRYLAEEDAMVWHDALEMVGSTWMDHMVVEYSHHYQEALQRTKVSYAAYNRGTEYPANSATFVLPFVQATVIG